MASLEDVFIEEDYAEKLVAENNLKKLRDIHFTGGLKEGLTAGKEFVLQDGFNSGYQAAFITSKKIGKLKGVLSAILSQINLREEYKNKSAEEEEVNSLLTELGNVEIKQQLEQLKTVLKDGQIPQEDTGKTSRNEVNALDSDQQFVDVWNKCAELCKVFRIDLQTICP